MLDNLRTECNIHHILWPKLLVKSITMHTKGTSLFVTFKDFYSLNTVYRLPLNNITIYLFKNTKMYHKKTTLILFTLHYIIKPQEHSSVENLFTNHGYFQPTFFTSYRNITILWYPCVITFYHMGAFSWNLVCILYHWTPPHFMVTCELLNSDLYQAWRRKWMFLWNAGRLPTDFKALYPRSPWPLWLVIQTPSLRTRNIL
jgi:hypothetical protein